MKILVTQASVTTTASVLQTGADKLWLRGRLCSGGRDKQASQCLTPPAGVTQPHRKQEGGLLCQDNDLQDRPAGCTRYSIRGRQSVCTDSTTHSNQQGLREPLATCSGVPLPVTAVTASEALPASVL